MQLSLFVQTSNLHKINTFFAGEIRKILTSGRNNLTSVYLDYINLLEEREAASKDAPTNEVKDNMTKIYNEINRSGMFSSLTEGIRGMFTNNNNKTVAASLPQPCVVGFEGKTSMLTYLASLPLPPSVTVTQLEIPKSAPKTYDETRSLMAKLRQRLEEGIGAEHEVQSFFIKIELSRLMFEIVNTKEFKKFREDLKQDSEARRDLRWLINFSLTAFGKKFQ